MPISAGRDILVHTEDGLLEAELVDETVMAVDESAQIDDAFSQFLKKTGKMRIFRKSRTRLQYSGIPAATREKIETLKTDVMKRIIYL